MGWHESAQAAILGMTLDTTPAQIARAALEGVLYQLARIDQALTGFLGEPPQIIAAGGVLAASPGWAQATADILDRPVSISVESESSARGAALLALDLQATPIIRTTIQPRPRYTARYQAAMDRQQRVYDLILGMSLTDQKEKSP